MLTWEQIEYKRKAKYYAKKVADGRCLRCTRMRDTKFATCSVCCEERRARYVAQPKHSLRDANGRFARMPCP